MQALQAVNKISFKNILFLTDFSEASSGALAYAVGLARHYNAQLYPAHACDPVILTETAGIDIVQEIEENSREQLTTLARESGVACTPLFARGGVEAAVPHLDH
jgi:nucleotide-binding universal stress UspA family protein